MKAIGPTFPHELKAANLLGLPFSWAEGGHLRFDESMTPEQVAAVQAVYAAHDPEAPQPASALEQIRAIEAPLDDDFKKITRQFMLGYMAEAVKKLQPSATTEQIHAHLYSKNKSYRLMYDMEQAIAPLRGQA